MHLMTSGKARHRRNKHNKKKSSDKKERKIHSRYDLKGKSRQPGTRPDKTAQIRLDRKLAEEEQARLYEEGIDEIDRNYRNPEKERSPSKYKKNDEKRPERAMGYLGMTQWIETPSPTPGVKVPEDSPIRALKQLPSGGYLAQAWTKGAENKRNTDGRKISAHTQRRIKRKQDRLQEWEDRSDFSDSGKGDKLPNGPPSPSDPSSSSSSGGSSGTSDSSTNTSGGTSGSSGTSDSDSDDDGTDGKVSSVRHKSLEICRKRRSELAKAIKYPEPSVYDGRAHLETFKTFVFEFTNWIKVNRLPEKYQMIAMKRFLIDKAGHHYMTFAAVNLRKWTVENYL